MEKIGPVLKKRSKHNWHNQEHPHMQSKTITSQKNLCYLYHDNIHNGSQHP